MTNLSELQAYASKRCIEELAPIAALTARGPFVDASADERLEVSEWTRRNVSRCSTLAAATYLQSYRDSVTTVSRAAALATLRHLGTKAESPPEAYRLAYAEGDPDRWPWTWLKPTGGGSVHADQAARALVGSHVAAFATAVARVAGGWPPLGLVDVHWKPRWDYPDNALRLSARVDFVVREPSRRETLVVVGPGGWDDDSRKAMAWVGLLGALSRRDIDSVLMHFPAVGPRGTTRTALSVELVEEAIGIAVATATAAAVGAGVSTAVLPRAAGRHCMRCPVHLDCPVAAEPSR